MSQTLHFNTYFTPKQASARTVCDIKFEALHTASYIHA
jgi:hypothetical protein